MRAVKICLVPGDGVGREVIPAAAEVLVAASPGIEFVECPAGFEHFQKTGEAIPDSTLAEIEAAGLALFGATASPSTQVQGYRSPILVMRKLFHLYANLRPVRSFPGPFSRPGVDFIIVRENTEGLYSGLERREGDTAVAERVITAGASEKIARAAFLQARLRRSSSSSLDEETSKRPPGRVTVVHKANVLKITDGLFRETCLRVAEEFADIRVTELLVDVAAMRLVRDPESFDVLVTTNLFGDILSDEGSALVGGLGVAPSANIGERVAVFEPVHGSAPDIAGQGIANPIAAILSGALLLEHIGHAGPAARIRQAVQAAFQDGVLPRDLGGNARTGEMTEAVLQNL